MARLVMAIVAVSVVVAALPAAADSAYSGRNGRLVFTDFVGGQGAGISTERPDGTRRRRIHQGGQDPAWSRDGKRIVFQDGDGLAVMKADGSEYRHIQMPVNVAAASPVWSPAARWIAFTAFVWPTGARDGDFETLVAKVRADGTNMRFLRPGSNPSWSPKGELIAYVGFEQEGPSPGGCQGIYVQTNTGGFRERVSGEAVCGRGGVAGTGPDFSPHGGRIAFSQPSRKPDGSKQFLDIYTIGVDGRNQRRVTRTERGSEGDVAYSPDGRFLAYGAFCGCASQAGFFISRVDGTGRRRFPADIRAASWQPLR